MRIINMATATVLLGLTTISSSAFASCNNGMSCGSQLQTINDHGQTANRYGHTVNHTTANHTYASQHYGHAVRKINTAGTQSLYSNHNSPTQSTSCPTGTSAALDGTCLVTNIATTSNVSTFRHHQMQPTYGLSSSHTSTYRTTHTGNNSHAMNNGKSYTGTLNSYASTTPFGATPSHSFSSTEASSRYGNGSISQSYSDGKNTIVPFSTRAKNLTNYRIPGMGANEFLTPTQCPVSVYNPKGGKVMGCYAVSKPAPTAPVIKRVHVPVIQAVRVIRPIIYVRYPIPTPYYYPVYQQHPPVGYGYNRPSCSNYSTSSRGHSYGSRWIGGSASYPTHTTAPRPSVCGR